jgi:hypothetical protein
VAQSGASGGAGSGGADTGELNARRICDGSPDIRFAFTFALSSGGVRPFTSLLYDLGTDFLYVNGACHYWVQKPTLPPDDLVFWRPYREGTLSQQQEAALHDLVGYDDISVGPIAHACGGESASDQASATLWDGQRVRRCDAQLDVAENFPSRDVLFGAATEGEGALRVQVGIDTVPPDAQVYEWPLSKSPETYAVDGASSTSARFVDASDVGALRQLRKQALADADASPALFPGTIVVEPRGYVRKVADETFVMSLRDDPPFTLEDGTWHPP